MSDLGLILEEGWMSTVIEELFALCSYSTPNKEKIKIFELRNMYMTF